MLVLVAIFTFHISSTDVFAGIEAWSNYRNPTGGTGDTLYLVDKVQVLRAIGGDFDSHYIQGDVTLVLNSADPYCYVKYDGVWYVHLSGRRTDNGVGTRGWFVQDHVTEAAKLNEKSGYIVYGTQGQADDGTMVKGEVNASGYTDDSG